MSIQQLQLNQLKTQRCLIVQEIKNANPLFYKKKEVSCFIVLESYPLFQSISEANQQASQIKMQDVLQQVQLSNQNKYISKMKKQEFIHKIKRQSIQKNKQYKKEHFNFSPLYQAKKIYHDLNKGAVFYKLMIEQYKQMHQNKPTWQQVLEHRCRTTKQQKQNLLKNLTYQTFKALQNQPYTHIQALANKVALSQGREKQKKQGVTFMKRMYDILNSLSCSGFIDMYRKPTRDGHLMKKDRHYRIKPQSYKKKSIKYLHVKVMKQQIKLRIQYKKKMLQAHKKAINTIRLAREMIKFNTKILHIPRVPLTGEVVAFYCTLNLDQEGNHVPCGDAQIIMSKDQKRLDIRSKFIDQNNIFLRTQLISKLYQLSYQKTKVKQDPNPTNKVLMAQINQQSNQQD